MIITFYEDSGDPCRCLAGILDFPLQLLSQVCVAAARGNFMSAGHEVVKLTAKY